MRTFAMAKSQNKLLSHASQILLASALSLCAACTTTTSPTAQDPDIVTIDQGTVRGEQANGTRFFKSLPFAAPPTGKNRWRAPQTAPGWSGIRDATQFGPDCIQPTNENIGSSHAQSEDCLTLNIAAPADAAASRLPVLFYIHGGAYFVGSGRTVLENGAPELVRQNAIIVAPNYRLGRLGFFAHPALTDETTASDEGTANFWLMDEIEALKWVHENIAAFGGDPENITLLGCSAGGSSVNALIASPKTRGLFDKAVVRSGGGFFNATRDLATAEAQGQAFAGRAGISGDTTESLARLRALSPEQVLAADPGPPNFGAMIDGTYLQDAISVTLADGNAAAVPLITGSTSNEASVFGLMGFDKQTLLDRFNVDVDVLRSAYEIDGELSEEELLRQVQTDFIFTSASVGMSVLSSANGAPAWSYYFDYLPKGERNTRPGADHCADMHYLFSPVRFEDPEDQAIADIMQSQILNFMRHGTPNGPGLPEWTEITPANPSPMVISTHTQTIQGFRRHQLEPWYTKWEAEKNRRFPRAADTVSN